MARAVLPRPSAASTWMLTGYSGIVPCSESRAAPLVLDEVEEEEESEDEGSEDEGGSADEGMDPDL